MGIRRQVFVTVGTTKFDSLINVVDTIEFQNMLSSLGYNQLIIQIGNYSGTIKNSIETQDTDDFRDSARGSEFRSCYYRYKASLSSDMDTSDLIITHGGSGTILETLEKDKSCVCVINETLMHNHQTELADKLAQLQYIISTVPEKLIDTLESKFSEYDMNRKHLDNKVSLNALREFSSSLSDQFPKDKPNKSMVVLGSGGHTAEMFYLLSKVDKKQFSPFIYVMANSDQRSEDKIHIAHNSSATGTNDFSVCKIPRSRNVGQSYIHSIWTTLVALFYCLSLLYKERPDVIICNGPGTCIPICFSALVLKWFRIKKCKIVYIESLARVQNLSLSGKIMQHFSDWFVVQWFELLGKVNCKNISVLNIFFDLVN
ncbi:hypothetical protein CYY_006858 [Polysphondylium violaceum]|uniref:UDP-N-acetylglucosamine transferase subunit ALG14 n=1 Tax=Polysphondylium violaceum TaxID=133409 RepID=A0A8J4UR94_9MYCE|nr:hypothetical protein CYY_006858 [Polysphondylium violaceum]